MVNVILMDQEFEKIVPEMKMALINTTAAREHVSDIEREIRTIKEGARTTVSTLTKIGVRYLPKQVIIHMVYFSVFWSNVPPDENGISDTWSSREIVLGQIVDYNLHCKEVFGAYVHGHNDYDVTNDMRPHTFVGIFFKTTGNLHVTVKV